MDQDRTPVLDEIARYHREGEYSFALPGHRHGRGVDARTAAVMPREVFAVDVATAKKAVPEAEELFADAVGARQAVFLTCGSSISIHTAILTVAGPGRKVLVDRNVHKSVVASLILAGARPVWLRPRWDHERQIAHPAGTGDVAAALEQNSDISAVIMITPTEYGTGADVRAIAAHCHRRGIPLLVDEAWGAHFPFHPDLPTAAVRAGADLVVQSMHKAAGGLMESSVILLGDGDRVDPVDLRLRLDLITTTSPSALMYGSTDGWRRQMAIRGREMLDAAVARGRRLRDAVAELPGLSVMGSDIVGQDSVAEWDPLKVCVDVTGLGITGYQAREWLRTHQLLDMQLGDARRVICSLTYADDDDAVARLIDALGKLTAERPPSDRPAPVLPDLEDLNLEQATTPREAFFAETEQVTDPVGRISAEMVSPYPPGVPAVLPGERFNTAVVDYLRAGKAAGMTVPDAADPTLATFRVVR
jgi:arginine/lysine/ornithine decarboxylase